MKPYRIFARIIVALLVLFSASCGDSNVCERRLEYEDEDCFPELEQGTRMDVCEGADKDYSKCAMSNKDAYCDYYLWQNRGAARQEGYQVSDFLPPGNEFVECLSEKGLAQR